MSWLESFCVAVIACLALLALGAFAYAVRDLYRLLREDYPTQAPFVVRVAAVVVVAATFGVKVAT